jgi:hypothetical protein
MIMDTNADFDIDRERDRERNRDTMDKNRDLDTGTDTDPLNAKTSTKFRSNLAGNQTPLNKVLLGIRLL